MDGIEATQEIRKMGGKYEQLTIIALTANAIAGAQKMFLDNGFNDFISKPIDMNELRSITKTYLPPEKIIVEEKDANRQSQLDKEEQLRNKAIVTFVKENKDTYARFTASLTAGDTTTAHRIVHTLKSGAGYLGKKRLQEAAFFLEQSLQENPPAFSPEQLHALELELEAALKELEPLIKNAETQKADAIFMDSDELAVLLSELEELLGKGDFGASEYVEKLRSVMGMEELADRVDDYDFEGALEVLKQIKDQH
jgi:HPt (histidine-containing phosphotransfer) domain-containing protein